MAVAFSAVGTQPGCGLVLVRCERFACRLSAVACATRHVARWPSGRRKGAPRFPPCSRCTRGAEVTVRLERRGWRRPPDSQPADVLDDRQRAARDRWVRSFPLHREPQAAGGDPLADAASATPDDEGEPADLG